MTPNPNFKVNKATIDLMDDITQTKILLAKELNDLEEQDKEYMEKRAELSKHGHISSFI